MAKINKKKIIVVKRPRPSLPLVVESEDVQDIKPSNNGGTGFSIDEAKPLDCEPVETKVAKCPDVGVITNPNLTANTKAVRFNEPVPVVNEIQPIRFEEPVPIVHERQSSRFEEPVPIVNVKRSPSLVEYFFRSHMASPLCSTLPLAEARFKTRKPKEVIQGLKYDLYNRAWRFFFGTRVSPIMETEGRDMIVRQNMEEYETVDEDAQPVTKRQRYNCMSEMATLCKISLPGITVYNEANVLVAQRYIAQRLNAKGVRPEHIKHILPIAVKMVFIEDDAEIAARQFMNTRAVINRLDLQNTTWYTRQAPSITNWFGTKRSAPVPRRN